MTPLTEFAAAYLPIAKTRGLLSAVLLIALSCMALTPAMAREAKVKKVAAHQTIGKLAKAKPKSARAAAYNPAPAMSTNNGRYATLIIDANTGEVLHQENADAPRRPASLTKMMTLYLTFQALDSGRLRLNSMLPVSQLASGQSPTKLGLREGQRIATEDAILGLVTESANDAAVVLAEAIGGNIDSFAAKMTQTARGLGMTNTTYQNPNGLPDPGQITTARDQARLGLALQRHFPRYYHYFSTPTFAYGGRMHPNHNRLMARYEGMDGIKTGFIRESGFNLVASCKRGDKRLIGVIFGGPSAAGRDNQLAGLLDAAFARANAQGDLPRTQMAQATAPIVQAAAVVSSMNTAQAEPMVATAPPAATRRDVTREITSADADVVAAAARDATAYDNGENDAGRAAAPVMQTASISAPLQPSVPAYQPAPQANTLQAPTPVNKPAARLAAKAEPRPDIRQPKVASANDNWGIQIGAYNDRVSGQRATALVADSMPDLLQNASPRVLSVATGTGTIYRARLVGMDEKAARSACTRLQSKSRPCMTLPPGNGTVNAWLASAEN